MFWDTFYGLCIAKGTKPNPLCKNLDISSAALTKWKTQNVIPSGENLLKIAVALECSIDYLLGRTDVVELCTEKPAPPVPDEEVLLARYRLLDEEGKELVRARALEYLRERQARDEGTGENAECLA